ncbi:hypothetical protein TNCV_205841 [Trichonephila clavipes]|nr:hypothetical protein TNCV_205841 [Trichonephila clavipes]
MEVIDRGVENQSSLGSSAYQSILYKNDPSRILKCPILLNETYGTNLYFGRSTVHCRSIKLPDRMLTSGSRMEVPGRDCLNQSDNEKTKLNKRKNNPGRIKPILPILSTEPYSMRTSTTEINGIPGVFRRRSLWKR